jgi:hypothetical protein
MGRHGTADQSALPVPVELRDNDGDFSLKSTAPDGSELTWRLSPQPLR